MSKIYDCCMVYNEMDMIETRMHILDDVVDYFVVCEAQETHSGHLKPLNFLANWDRFRSWHSKIIYVNAGLLSDGKRNSWERERYHRSKIAEGLIGAQNEDWIIVGDMDEIPDPLPVDLLRNFPLEVQAVKFELLMYYYDLNHRVKQGWAIGGARWGYQKDPNKIRTTEGAAIEDVARLSEYHSGGWHFSYFGGAQAIVEKVDAFMHAGDPVIRDLPRDPAFIAERVAAGADLYGRSDMHIEHVALADTLPRYILDHIDEYRAKGWCE